MTDALPPPAPRRRLGAGAVVVLVVAAFAVTVAIGLLRGSPQAAETVAPRASPSSAAIESGAAQSVYVHVAGAVGAAGVYALPADARVADAVAAAGGFAEGADTGAVNLARTIADGEQIRVPLVGEVPAAPGPPGQAEGGAGGADGVIDLNTADAAALDSLPGIGPALAERILAWRSENERFASVDDLLAVPGIGDKLLAGLRERVRV